jgi:uncharacterized protein with FMN-binding domain
LRYTHEIGAILDASIESDEATMSPKPENGSGKKSTNNLVALGSMAVLGVYAAGYVRTQPAAERFALAAQRHPAAVIARTDESSRPEPSAAPIAAPASAAVATPSTTPTPPPATDANAHAAAPDAARLSAPLAPLATTSSKTSSTSAAEPAKDSATAKPAAPKTATVAATVFPTAPVRTDSVPAKVVVPPPIDSAAIKEAAKQKAAWKDGAYMGYGTSRHGDIEATVEVKDGKIISASISRCGTQYSCSWISALPPQVITRQSAEVDYVSGATQSSNAFYAAVVDALNKAK